MRQRQVCESCWIEPCYIQWNSQLICATVINTGAADASAELLCRLACICGRLYINILQAGGSNMKKLKLMTFVGTRPEIIKMSAIMKKCDTYFDQRI